jgi:hypothetical protein
VKFPLTSFVLIFHSQLEAMLAIEEPSPYVLQLMQGLVSAFDREVGGWSAIKETLRTLFLSIRAGCSLPSLAPIHSVDFNGDDGGFFVRHEYVSFILNPVPQA